MSPLVTGRSISKMKSSRLTENEILYWEANMNEPGLGVCLGCWECSAPTQKRFHRLPYSQNEREPCIFQTHQWEHQLCELHPVAEDLLEVLVLPGGSLSCGVGKGATGLLIQPRISLMAERERSQT